MSYRNEANKKILPIIDYYNTSADADDDDVLRKSYSMPLSMQDFPSATPIISTNDKASPSQEHQHSSSSMILRTSKSEENTATTATHLVQPQHKLDRYGFIVNMDVHGNIISSQRENSIASKNHSSQHNYQTLKLANNTNTGTKSSSSYSMDTNYDRPNAARLTASKGTPKPPTTAHRNTDDGINATTMAASQIKQQQATTNPGKRARKHYMQRRTKPLTISEAARTARRIMKWDTMLRYNIPSEVVTLQEQQQGREHQQERHTFQIKILQPPLSRKQRRYNTMKRRLRKGVPNQRQRSVIWPILCNVSAKMSASPGLYHRLLFEITQHDLTEPTQETINTATTAFTTGTPTTTTSSSTSNTSATNATKGYTTTGGEVEDYTKIEMNYTRATQATDYENGLARPPPPPPPPPPAIQFQYTKSFHSIQETIERDLHRTFPRHCMFYSTEVDDDEDDCYAETNHSLDEDFVTNPVSDINHGDKGHPKLILGDVDTEDQHSSDTREIQQKSICGTNEISNLIRELDLVPQVATHLMNHQAQPPAPTIATAATAMDHHHGDTATSHPITPISETEPAKNHSSDLKTVVNGSNKDTNPPSHTNNSIGMGNISNNQISPSSAKNNSHNTTTTTNNNTYTNENLLDGEGGQSRLRRVLKAYSLYDREIGYCQGMNFIAAMFLTIVTEEYAFWMLVAVMHDRPCQMRGMFGEGMRETHQALYVADKLIQQFLPRLAKHFEKESIHVTMYATQWLLTQFTSSFRFDLVTRLWDSFLFEGWKATYRVMLAILQRSQNDLLALSFEDILAYFRDLPDRPDFDGSVVDDSMKIPLKTSHIRKYEIEWRSQQL